MFRKLHLIPLLSLICLTLICGLGQARACQDEEPEQAQPTLTVQDDEFEEVEVDDDDIEEDMAEEAVAIANPWGVEQGSMMAAKKFHLIQLYTVEAEQIARICKLDKKQALKLKIATKGAVKKGTAAWLKRAGNQFGGMGIAADEEGDDDEKEAVEEVVITDADEIDEMTMQMVMMDGMGNPFKMTDPLDSRFWKKAVSSVLSDEQLVNYKKYKADRKSAKRESLISAALGTMKVELALTDEQVPKFADVIRPPMLKGEINCHAFYEPYIVYYYASKADNKKLKKLLSPAQMQKWKLFVAPSKQIGQMMEMEDGMGMGMEAEGVWDEAETVVGEIAEGIGQLFDGFVGE